MKSSVEEALDPKELDVERAGDENEALLDEIIRNLPAENSTSNLFSHWNQASGDLEFEFDDLLNLK